MGFHRLGEAAAELYLSGREGVTGERAEMGEMGRWWEMGTRGDGEIGRLEDLKVECTVEPQHLTVRKVDPVPAAAFNLGIE